MKNSFVNNMLYKYVKFFIRKNVFLKILHLPKMYTFLQFITLLIGILHLGFLGFGVCGTIQDVLDEEDPAQVNEILSIIGYVFFHLLIILLLFGAVLKKNRFYLVPWLSCTFIVLTFASYYTVMDASGLNHFLKNAFQLSILWFCWVCIFFYWRELKHKYEK